MENQNPGSFGSVLGGGGDIKAALNRRGLGGGATSQVSPAAPTSSVQPPPAPSLPSGGGMPTPPSSGGMGLPPNSGESMILTKAIDSRLKTLSKLQEQGIQV